MSHTTGIGPGIGVDGCRGGWTAAAVLDGQILELRAAQRFLAAIDMQDPTAAEARHATVLVDMPMGLTLDGTRGLDATLRARLPVGRKSSVFPVPSRSAFHAVSHADASDRNALVCGKRIPIQTYQIMPKIAELDALLHMHPALQTRCRESHPELCFHILAQCLRNDEASSAPASVLPPKRTAAGRFARRSVLCRHGLQTGALKQEDSWLALLRSAPDTYASSAAGLAVAEDDLLDALCLALVASRPNDWETLHDPLRASDEQGIALQIILPNAGAWRRHTETMPAHDRR